MRDNIAYCERLKVKSGFLVVVRRLTPLQFTSGDSSRGVSRFSTFNTLSAQQTHPDYLFLCLCPLIIVLLDHRRRIFGDDVFLGDYFDIDLHLVVNLVPGVLIGILVDDG